MVKSSWRRLQRIVYERANGCCEYCQTCERNTGQTMQVDHIDPHGADTLENLCLACWNCNSSKHKATTAVDPMTREAVALFNPRTQHWTDHFRWSEDSTRIIGMTRIGRATVGRLKMNRPRLVLARIEWVKTGSHPPM